MAASPKRSVIVKPAPDFKHEYHALKAEHSGVEQADIEAKIVIFNEYKREIPPRRLPDDMMDHKLSGGLKGISECHLAGDMTSAL